jgi:signal transduction histidine kinase
LELDIHEDWDELPPEVEQTYYRVAQEALENIAKHANANKITLTLSGNSDNLNLTIRDDGRGFTPQEISEKRQLGLQGMQERAELIDALLTIDGQIGEGTIVQLKMIGKQ